MMFESEYRRKAMAHWDTTKAETQREIAEDCRRAAKNFTSVVDRLHTVFVSLFPYSRSHHRY
ncbi:hypothetical protein [Paenibacillus alkalitolerans]|uniref:hypothetical protein n=1 Tax=Paenibacillus alkalitolerans TaxID=2799335 RepID=UPI0018F5961A|nr:hypothetical protein [Paenibacillus alkalitolerans]